MNKDKEARTGHSDIKVAGLVDTGPAYSQPGNEGMKAGARHMFDVGPASWAEAAEAACHPHWCGAATDESARNTTEQSRTQSSPVTPRPPRTCNVSQTRVARPRHVPRGLVTVREPCPTGAGAGTVVDMDT